MAYINPKFEELQVGDIVKIHSFSGRARKGYIDDIYPQKSTGGYVRIKYLKDENGYGGTYCECFDKLQYSNNIIK